MGEAYEEGGQVEEEDAEANSATSEKPSHGVGCGRGGEIGRIGRNGIK